MMFDKFCFLLLYLLILNTRLTTEAKSHDVSLKNDYENSGHSWDDDDYYNEDDDDDDDDDNEDEYENQASASGPTRHAPTQTPTVCQQQREAAITRQIVAAYVPRCDVNGLYEPMQCSDNSQQCWCVYVNGSEIPRTNYRFPAKPSCDSYRVTSSTVIEAKHRPTQSPTISSKSERRKNGMAESQPDTMSPRPDADLDTNGGNGHPEKQDSIAHASFSPGILAGIVGCSLFGLLCAILLVLFIVYRMRKRDEGSYCLDEPKKSPVHGYTKAKDREFFA